MNESMVLVCLLVAVFFESCLNKASVCFSDLTMLCSCSRITRTKQGYCWFVIAVISCEPRVYSLIIRYVYIISMASSSIMIVVKVE
jgi:hypothetical protein